MPANDSGAKTLLSLHLGPLFSGLTFRKKATGLYQPVALTIEFKNPTHKGWGLLNLVVLKQELHKEHQAA
jgi:hypothetical protein